MNNLFGKGCGVWVATNVGGHCAHVWLPKDGCVELTSGEYDHEDGSSSQSQILFEFDGTQVFRTSDTQTNDCDGRMDFHDELVADLDSLQARYHNHVHYPSWDRVPGRSHQRDYRAESMGY